MVGQVALRPYYYTRCPPLFTCKGVDRAFPSYAENQNGVRGPGGEANNIVTKEPVFNNNCVRSLGRERSVGVHL